VILCVNLALDEIVTNVISYAYGDARQHEILVHLALERGELAVCVVDDGRPFNPVDAPPVDLDADMKDRPIGGLGIQIVRSVMDALDYRREDGRNILTMRKAAGSARPG
jgi:anti-sigma regulatory factor (Ser/Thr protein kinase)